MIGDGRQRGEVRQGRRERVALPVFAALHGYAGLTVSGFIPPDPAQDGLDDTIASVLHGCEPPPE
ncbi:hypothetical protein [Nonomuraea sp. NPDC049607]|uniref:hypothetical protein n=1 Tax=Nonomuraea sp. NPDC049607 TaxID=3154732 RepID=UPI00342B7C49